MRYNNHWVIMLITLILLIYHLEYVSILNKTENPIFNGKERVILKDRMSLQQFKRRTNTLKKEVDHIASIINDYEDEEDVKPVRVKQSNTIVYNRIDKAGSTTLIKTLDKMSFKNSFYLIGQGTPNLRYFDAHQKKKLADIFCKSGADIVYTRHLYYTNFTHYGCDVQYFNIMRDPVSRFISRYTYYREIYEKKKSENYFGSQGTDRSENINDCFLKNHEECQYEGVLTRMLKFFRMDSQIPYFCGDSEECRTLGSRKALETAKANIETTFLTVGVLEDLDMTHQVMECLMPSQFSGLAKEHAHHDLHVHSHHKDKEDISDEAKTILKERLNLEYELYEFVRKRLIDQNDECQKIMKSSS